MVLYGVDGWSIDQDERRNEETAGARRRRGGNPNPTSGARCSSPSPRRAAFHHPIISAPRQFFGRDCGHRWFNMPPKMALALDLGALPPSCDGKHRRTEGVKEQPPPRRHGAEGMAPASPPPPHLPPPKPTPPHLHPPQAPLAPPPSISAPTTSSSATPMAASTASTSRAWR